MITSYFSFVIVWHSLTPEKNIGATDAIKSISTIFQMDSTNVYKWIFPRPFLFFLSYPVRSHSMEAHHKNPTLIIA